MRCKQHHRDEDNDFRIERCRPHRKRSNVIYKVFMKTSIQIAMRIVCLIHHTAKRTMRNHAFKALTQKERKETKAIAFRLSHNWRKQINGATSFSGNQRIMIYLRRMLQRAPPFMAMIRATNKLRKVFQRRNVPVPCSQLNKLYPWSKSLNPGLTSAKTRDKNYLLN
ncbi:uncharacterized protein LOC125049766 [Pieris napi]|uniref:uncharacterized protein LOC125049766 n=1 Tax=Pieris napi TaxID=78633 RepID=UPI001FB903CC|nr:uncharacterized protein LOC125049766 [Pieris napi]